MLIRVHSENVAGGCWRTMEYTADTKRRPSGMCCIPEDIPEDSRGTHMQHLPTWCDVQYNNNNFILIILLLWLWEANILIDITIKLISQL